MNSIIWQTCFSRGGRPFSVPSSLPHLEPADAIRTVTLPLHLTWSDSHAEYDLGDPRQRARVYEIVLREGTPSDIENFVDGALLRQTWDHMTLPRVIRGAWEPLLSSPRSRREPGSSD